MDVIVRAWDDFILLQKPEIFATFTFGEDFFRRKDDAGTHKITRTARDGAVKQCTLSFLRILSRRTKQHVRMIYGSEDILSEVEKSPTKSHYPWKRTQDKRTHMHGLLVFEHGADRVCRYVEDKKPHYGSSGVEDALSHIWAEHMKANYDSCVYGGRGSEKAFQKFSASKSGVGSYSCFKHSEGELIMDACPRCKHICRKGKGDCAFHWSNKSYE